MDGRKFDDQLVNDLIKQQHEVRKVSIKQGGDYTSCCLLDYAYLKDNQKLIAVYISKRKSLDADPRVIQRMVFLGVVGEDGNTKIRL